MTVYNIDMWRGINKQMFVTYGIVTVNDSFFYMEGSSGSELNGFDICQNKFKVRGSL
jgi:hypothetical protein